jgi:hypothetical protein
MIKNRNIEKTKEALQRLKGRYQKYQVLLNKKKENEVEKEGMKR